LIFISEISELEQTIVNSGEHSACLDALKRLIANPSTTEINALRLSMLYALRFENHANNSLRTVMDLLLKSKCSPANVNNVKLILDYAGARRRQNDVFGNRSAMEMTKRFIKGLKGVENIYTQHEPYINQLIDQVVRGRLPETTFISSDQSHYSTRFDNVIVFVIGGATYEESSFVAGINAKRSQTGITPKVILCSNYIHNTKSFIQQLSHFGTSSGSSLS